MTRDKANMTDGRTVAAMDVLAPGIGEIIGGSQREERLEVLDRNMAERGIDREHYAWYRDLRRYGTVPHAGFGLGFERTLAYVTGLANVRDAIQRIRRKIKMRTLAEFTKTTLSSAPVRVTFEERGRGGAAGKAPGLWAATGLQADEPDCAPALAEIEEALGRGPNELTGAHAYLGNTLSAAVNGTSTRCQAGTLSPVASPPA